jgi:hypothetical protein
MTSTWQVQTIATFDHKYLIVNFPAGIGERELNAQKAVAEQAPVLLRSVRELLTAGHVTVPGGNTLVAVDRAKFEQLQKVVESIDPIPAGK